jgi:hypothetical protein
MAATAAADFSDPNESCALKADLAECKIRCAASRLIDCDAGPRLLLSCADWLGIAEIGRRRVAPNVFGDTVTGEATDAGADLLNGAHQRIVKPL